MEWLKDFVGSFFHYFFIGLQWLASAVCEMFFFILFTIYDGLLTIVYNFTRGIDLSSMAFNIAAGYAELPTQLIWMVNQVGLPQSMTYIVGAIIIRLAINLIPAEFTRV